MKVQVYLRKILHATALLALPLATHSMRAAGAAQSAPNIIFILTDDQRWNTLGCMGDPLIKTPNIDRLAAQGVRFTNHFVTTSICCVSRASIFTGQYMRRHGIANFATPFTAGQWAETYPALLRAHGYYTGFIGKFGVGDDAAVNAMAGQFDYWKGVPGQGGKYFIDPADPSRTHETARFGEDALEFLGRTPAHQPFCLSVSFTAPHARDQMPHAEQYQPDRRDLGLYRDEFLPSPATATDAYFEKLPASVQTSISRQRWHWRFDTPEKYEHSAKDYYRLVSGIDREVGRIMAELGRRGLTGNTVIIFTSDNGYFLGDRQLSDKFYMYEESLRDPLIVLDPREPEGHRHRVETAMTLNIDLAPTMLALAGISAPEKMQGRSLAALLHAEHPADWRTDFFYEHHYLPDRIPSSEGVRTTQFAYIRWINETPLVEELYDVQKDPLEAHNLVNDAAAATALAHLRQRWSQYATELK